MKRSAMLLATHSSGQAAPRRRIPARLRRLHQSPQSSPNARSSPPVGLRTPPRSPGPGMRKPASASESPTRRVSPRSSSRPV